MNKNQFFLSAYSSNILFKHIDFKLFRIHWIGFVLSLTVFTAGAQNKVFIGRASYYAKSFEGRKTANGEKYSNYDMTCASRTLAFHTFLKITNLKNNLVTIVRVNDRGPYAKNRIIDLTEQAARIIGSYKHGITKVKLEIIQPPQNADSIEKIFMTDQIIDADGLTTTPSGYTISIWRTRDFDHALLLAKYLQQEEYIQSFFIGKKNQNGRPLFHILVLNIATQEEAFKLRDFWERKGFMRVKMMEKF